MTNEIKRCVQAIKETNFAELLIEAMAEGVFTVDGKGLISSWNPAMHRISGFSQEDVIGKPCSFIGFDLCSGKDCPSSISECEIFKKGKIDAKECYLRHKNGERIAVLKNARLYKDNYGNAHGVVETITDMTELNTARRIAEEARRELVEVHKFGRILGKSNVMATVFSLIKASASSESTILIEGESGTGKELVAGAIHYNSRRSKGPFKTVNCSALSESLLESELFGHVKGAFSGAYRDRAGYFEDADGGTLFLDEIAEISPYIQVKLLRFIQQREFERVGESIKRKVDLRIIAATNKNLYELVKEGGFREDLYYRLKVFPIKMPSLKERKDDIPLLIKQFIRVQNSTTKKNIKGVSHEAMRLLLDYNWPGNVRELENAIEHGFVLCEKNYIDISELPVEIRKMDYYSSVPDIHMNRKVVREELNREKLMLILKESKWNKAEVARRTGFSRASVWKYMKKWDIPLKE